MEIVSHTIVRLDTPASNYFSLLTCLVLVVWSSQICTVLLQWKLLVIFAYCPKISDDYTNMQSDIMPLNSIIDNVWLHKFSKGKRKDNHSKLFASTLPLHRWVWYVSWYLVRIDSAWPRVCWICWVKNAKQLSGQCGYIYIMPAHHVWHVWVAGAGAG